MERTRLAQSEDREQCRSLERSIGWLGRESARIEDRLSRCVENLPDWAEQGTLLRSAPGVGPKTARCVARLVARIGPL